MAEGKVDDIEVELTNLQTENARKTLAFQAAKAREAELQIQADAEAKSIELDEKKIKAVKAKLAAERSKGGMDAISKRKLARASTEGRRDYDPCLFGSDLGDWGVSFLVARRIVSH
jgi:hypothetical protein